MNRDGLLDVVAARATAPADPAGELVWFEQPPVGAVSNRTHSASPWAAAAASAVASALQQSPFALQVSISHTISYYLMLYHNISYYRSHR